MPKLTLYTSAAIATVSGGNFVHINEEGDLNYQITPMVGDNYMKRTEERLSEEASPEKGDSGGGVPAGDVGGVPFPGDGHPEGRLIMMLRVTFGASSRPNLAIAPSAAAAASSATTAATIQMIGKSYQNLARGGRRLGLRDITDL